MSFQTKINNEDFLLLEQPLLKVPLENLQRSLRGSRKIIERELNYISGVISDLAKSGASSQAQNDPFSPQETLDAAVARLEKLKQSLLGIQKDENGELKRSKERIDHLNRLKSVQNVDDSDLIKWCNDRLSRELVDHLIRSGHLQTAAHIITKKELGSITDLALFTTARIAEEALLRKSCTECLQWCNDNRSTLRKLKIPLEFELRLQEYIELVKQRRLPEAITYSKKHLMPFADTHICVIQKAMALLAFPPSTDCKPYKDLYDEIRWQSLRESYKSAYLLLHCLPSSSMLAFSVSSGLCALKTTSCSTEKDGSTNINCPVCYPPLGDVAKELPFSHRLNSCIVDRIDGTILDETNPPLIMPNGNAYGTTALHSMADSGSGFVTDPSTGEVFVIDHLKKAYVL